MTMQNWDHIQFVFSNLNQMPKDSHDTDFSRIKPWVLDGKYVHTGALSLLHSDLDSSGAFLRQTVLFTAYETPRRELCSISRSRMLLERSALSTFGHHFKSLKE
jgi:hypothetical protein